MKRCAWHATCTWLKRILNASYVLIDSWDDRVLLFQRLGLFQTSKLLERAADGNVAHVNVMMTFVDVARKFGLWSNISFFFVLGNPRSAIFRFGHSITKSHWLQFILYTTADDRGRSVLSCWFCLIKRLVFCGFSSNRAAKLSLVVAFHYLPLPSCTLVRCLLHTNEVPSSIFISVNLEQ